MAAFSFTLKTNLANKGNYGSWRATSSIKYCVIHYTANDGDTDEANAKYFKNNKVSASAHYFVDDDSVTISVPENYVAWHCGGSRYKNYVSTGGAKCYGKCVNSNSIGVELCDCEKNGRYNFTDKTLNNAVELVRDIVKRFNIPRTNCIRHFDVSGKICPAPFVNDVAAWNAFLDRVYGSASTGNQVTTNNTTKFVKGDKVKVLRNVTYTGGTFKVWFTSYDVIAVKGTKVTIGRGSVVTCNIHQDNITKI